MIYDINKSNFADFSVFKINRLAGRSYFIPYGSKSLAQKADYKYARFQSDRVSCLNGIWDFKYFKHNGALPSKIDTDSFQFDKLKVPSCWQFEGLEAPIYVNTRYLFNCNPPKIPTDKSVGRYKDGASFSIKNGKNVYNSVGVYRRFIEIQDIEKTYIVSFLGVASCMDLYLNGRFVGYSEGSHNTAEFDLSDYVVSGVNEMLVVVHKWCNGSYLESQDMFRNCGIFRDVLLYVSPKAYIFDYALRYKKEENGEYDCKLAVSTKNAVGLYLRASLEKDGEKVFEELRPISEDEEIFEFSGKFAEYSAENPQQYSVYICLIDKLAKEHVVSECIRGEVGFKTVEIKNGVFLYNGQPIKLLGVNHHDTNPERGYCLSADELLRDVKIFKEYNINAVRTSHYPPDPIFLQMCAEYGIYVIDEADIETHGAMNAPVFNINQISNNKKWAEHYWDRVKQMYDRDKNLACVTMWSLGNEAGGFKCHDYCYAALKKLTTLPIHYEGVVRTKRKCYDVISMMYPSSESVKQILSGVKRKDLPADKPFFLCEYAHAMGLGPGGLKEYLEVFEGYDRAMGGCIWEFCDHAVYHSEGKNIYTYGGDHGEFIHDGNFCVDGLFFPDRRPHTGALNMKYFYRPLTAKLVDNSTLRIFNKNYFIDSSYVNIICTVVTEGKVISKFDLQATISPRTSRDFDIFFGEVEGDKFLNVEYINKETGKTIAVEQIEISVALTQVEHVGGSGISFFDRRNVVEIKFDSGVIRLDKASGNIVNYILDGKDFLKSDPTRNGTNSFVTNIMRPRIDNDVKRLTNINSAKVSLTSFKCELYPKDENGKVTFPNRAEIYIEKMLYAGKGSTYRVLDNYTVYASGYLDVKSKLIVGKHNINKLDVFGKQIRMPKGFDTVIYYGRGEKDNYPDMKEHSIIGLYVEDSDSFAHPYIMPQESGNRCDTRYAIVKNYNGEGLMFLAKEEPFCLNIKRHSKAEIDNAKHFEDLGEPEATYVGIDCAVSGVGSNSCGPALDKQYALTEKEYNLEFRIIPIKNVNEMSIYGKSKE